MNMFRLWRLFHRSGTRGASGRTSALAIVAFASATAVLLTVLGDAWLHLAGLRRPRSVA